MNPSNVSASAFAPEMLVSSVVIELTSRGWYRLAADIAADYGYNADDVIDLTDSATSGRNTIISWSYTMTQEKLAKYVDQHAMTTAQNLNPYPWASLFNNIVSGCSARAASNS